MNPADKPIFADEIGVLVRVKATKDEKQAVYKEGTIGIIFIDATKKLILGEFVVSKYTAKNLIKPLSESIEKLEKELASKDMPKPSGIATTSDFSNVR